VLTNTGALGVSTSAPTNSLVVNASGNVGVGTSSPATKLDVKGAENSLQARFGNISNRGLEISTAVAVGTTDAASIFNAKGATSGTMIFQTDSTERMRIDSSGYVLIGTTSYNYGATTNTFQIAVDDSSNVISRNSTATRQLFVFNNPNGQVGAINISGSATSYLTSSDYRLKENIAPMTGALDKVSLLKPVTYKWKVDGSDGQGFIAHELQAVAPDAVTGEKDGVDAEGNPVYQGIDTSFLVATLTAAIQELNAKVEAQAEQIKALQGAV
jgi:hypothetical protein